MRFTVTYIKPKKKGTSSQKATFFDAESASLWEQYVRSQGAKEIQILVS
jgi:hypothetical protein